MAGFGRSPFGRGPFGRSDLGRDLIVDLFPDEYMNESLALSPGETIKDNNKDPLLKLLNTYKELVNRRRKSIDELQELLDYDAAPLEIIFLWGEMLGLGIDKNDPEFLQRSLLGNASQWLQIKGSRRGYEVRGLASGFTVAVENFWRIDTAYDSLLPARRKFLFKPKGADASAVEILHTDAYPGEFPGTPLEEDETYAKSSYIRITFEVAEPRRAGVDYNALLDLVIDKIKDVVAIHHELFRVVFQIRMNVDASNITVDMLIEEDSILNAMVQGIYDIEAADVHPTDDMHLTVEIVGFSSGYVIDLDVSPEVEIIPEETNFVPMEVDVNETATLEIEEHVQDIQVYVANYFDIVPGDDIDLDSPGITVTMTVEEIEPILLMMSVPVNPDVDSSSPSNEESFLEVDSTDAYIEGIEVTTGMGVAATPSINFGSGVIVIPVNVSPSVGIEIPSAEVQINLNAQPTLVIFADEESEVAESVLASIDYDIPPQDMILPVSVSQSVSSVHNEEAGSLVDAEASIDYLVVTDAVVLNANLSMSVGITKIDAEFGVQFGPAVVQNYLIAEDSVGSVEVGEFASLIVEFGLISEVAVSMSAQMVLFDGDSNIFISPFVDDEVIQSLEELEMSASESVAVSQVSETGLVSEVETYADVEIVRDDKSQTLVVQASVVSEMIIEEFADFEISGGLSIELIPETGYVYQVAVVTSVEIVRDEKSLSLEVPVSMSATIAPEETVNTLAENNLTASMAIELEQSMDAEANVVAVIAEDAKEFSISVVATVLGVQEASEELTAMAELMQSVQMTVGSGYVLEINTGLSVAIVRDDKDLSMDVSSALSVTAQSFESAATLVVGTQSSEISSEVELGASVSAIASVEIAQDDKDLSMSVNIGLTGDQTIAEITSLQSSVNPDSNMTVEFGLNSEINVGETADYEHSETWHSNTNVSVFAALDAEEAASLEAGEIVGVAVSQISEAMTKAVEAAPSVLFNIPTAEISLSVAIGLSSPFDIFEESEAEVMISNLFAFEFAEELTMAANLAQTVAIDIPTAMIPLDVTVVLNSPFDIFEEFTTEINVGETVVFAQDDKEITLEVSAANASIFESIFEQLAAEVSSSISAAMSPETEFSVSVNANAVGSVELIEEASELEVPVGEDVDIEIPLPPPSEIDIDVDLTYTAIIDPIYEVWSQAINVGVGTSWSLSESSESVDEKGWIIDPLYTFDITPADAVNADASGVVTMTITVGP